MLVYYAHCIAIYNTQQELDDLETLDRLGLSVLNPNTPEHNTSDMQYYLKLVRNCDAVAYRRLPDGRISSGVWAEIQEAKKHGLVVLELPYLHNQKVMTREETREYIGKRRF